MVRYIALLWDAKQREQHGAAMSLSARLKETGSHWPVVMERPGALIFRSMDTPLSHVHSLYGGQGVVLGTLHDRSSEACARRRAWGFDEHDSASIVATDGRHLLKSFWGHYVAVIRNAQTHASCVLRDPTGGIACHRRTFRGVDIYFSRLRDHDLLKMPASTVNWHYIKGSLVHPSVFTGETGLTEIQEVLAGQCVQRRAGQESASFAWNPLDIVKTDIIDEPAIAVDKVRQTTRACVHAWASRYEGIIHQLSGGLDSSIVAACLRDAPTRPRVACLNYYSAGSDTDERPYARMAAKAAGFDLIEVERQSPDLRLALNVPMTPHPTHLACYLECGRNEAKMAKEMAASAFFSGNVGDNLFYVGNEGLAVSDHLARRGLTRELFGIALNAAYLERRSVWSVLACGVQSEWFGKRWSPQAYAGVSSSVVPADLINEVKCDTRYVHPLYRDGKGVSGAKIFHAYGMTYCASPRPDPFEEDDDPDELSPLFSQPLIELSLRIPIDVLITGGRDRAIAREAFKNDLPPALIRRWSKGGLEDHLKTVILDNLSVVRPLLFEGHLANRRMIDRQKVEAALASGPTGATTLMFEIYTVLSLEAWLQSACNRQGQREAA